MKTFLTILITALIVAASTWFFLKSDKSSESAAEKQPLFYQSAMHPWIKSDKPGRCTICGMELTPVYPGDKGFDQSGGEDIIALSDSQVRVLNVATENAAVRELGQTLEVAGTIDDNALAHRIVSPYVDARIDKLYNIFEGAKVTKDEPLMKIYSPNLLQAEREYRRLTGDLKAAAALRLKQMGLSDSQILEVSQKPENSLSSTILSPMSGTIVSRSAYEGQYVKEGETLMEIGAQAFVYVDLGEGTYRQAPVKTGRRGGEYLEVLDGVEAGEKVVTNGTLLIGGQAEMNRSFSSAPKETKKDAPVLDESHIASITEFLKTADAMSAALAADDLASFNKAAEPAMMKAGDLVEKLKDIAPEAELKKLADSRHFHGFEDIAKARAAYLPFSMAAQSILAPFALPDARISECPMVNSAIPGAKKTAAGYKPEPAPSPTPTSAPKCSPAERRSSHESKK